MLAGVPRVERMSGQKTVDYADVHYAFAVKRIKTFLELFNELVVQLLFIRHFRDSG